MSNSNGGEIVVEALVDAGVTHVFGMSGHSTLPILDALYEHPSIRFVLGKQEQAIGGMADGYARASGRPGVCLVHIGPSAANLLINVGAAYRESSPLIALTCNEQTFLEGRDVFNSWDQLTPFSHVTKWAGRAYRAADIPRVMRTAFVRSTFGRPGPVQVDLPLDVLREATEIAEAKKPAYKRYSARTRPDPELLTQVLPALAQAQQPVILIGDGLVWAEGSAELERVAERLQVPVLATQDGRGTIPEEHPLFAGVVGMWGHATGNDALRNADLVLGLGCRFSDTDTLSWSLISPGATIIQVDADPAVIAQQYAIDFGFACDPRGFLQDLLALVLGAAPPAGRAERVHKLHVSLEEERAKYLGSAEDKSPVPHVRLVKELAAHMDSRAIVTAGAGRHSFHASRLAVQRPRSFIKSTGFGMMGFAFPAALGAQLASPDARVWCLVGDGDFSMTVQDLETAVREKLNVVTVVFNDSSYSSVEQIQRTQYGERPIGVRYQRTDFARLAEAFGAYGVSVSRSEELSPALTAALEAGRPAVIDVAVEPL